MHVACYLPCLTQICEALIYSSPAANCCCKAVYWPRPTMMPHPSIAAAWPTFIACHTVASVPVSGDKPKEKPNSYWKAHTLKKQNSKCSINSNSQITNLGFTVKRYHFLTWKPHSELSYMAGKLRHLYAQKLQQHDTWKRHVSLGSYYWI